MIVVISRLGEGKSTSIHMPIGQLTRISKTGSKKLANLHILLIDDDASVLRSIKFLLERCGYGISEYTDPAKALDSLRLDSSRFDLMVIDYNMPSMSGTEVASAVRKIRKGMPIAITSGYIDEELRSLADEVGVQEFIPKPCSLDDLIAIVERLAHAGCR
jgi:CheY-like chemotaxis protein